MPVGAQMVVVLKGFIEHSVSLVRGHPFECSWLEVSQTDVFHRPARPGGSQQHSLVCWIVHPSVAPELSGRLQCAAACRRRCSLAFMISFMSPTGRISQMQPYFSAGC